MAYLNGRGAWSTLGKDNGSRYYCYLSSSNMDGAKPDLDKDHLAVHYGVISIQRRLDTLGFRGRSGGRLVVDGVFGQKTKRAVKWFQSTQNLPVDGTVGSTTAQHMWRPLVSDIGSNICGRPDLLWGMTMLESAADPGAVSSRYLSDNGPDYGLCQINLHFNPDVSMEQAFSARFALTWSAERLADSLAAYAGKGETLQTACAIAHHNSPIQAAQWYLIGSPPSDQIANYVKLVLGRALTF